MMKEKGGSMVKNKDIHIVCKNIGAFLKSVRMSKHLSMADVYNNTGIDVSTICRVESAISNNSIRKEIEPKISTLIKLSTYYKIPLCELFKHIENGNPGNA